MCESTENVVYLIFSLLDDMFSVSAVRMLGRQVEHRRPLLLYRLLAFPPKQYIERGLEIACNLLHRKCKLSGGRQ